MSWSGGTEDGLVWGSHLEDVPRLRVEGGGLFSSPQAGVQGPASEHFEQFKLRNRTIQMVRKVMFSLSLRVLNSLESFQKLYKKGKS